jgi:6-phosphogluconolactonase (cycloisomerase 2 family)
VDPTGQFAYVANNNNNTVSAYSIGANGALTQLSGSPFAARSGPVSVAVDPTGQFAYVVNDNNVSAYSIGTNGSLKPLPGSPFPTGPVPTSVAVDPRGKFAYVALFGGFGTGQGSGVSAYSIGADGALTPVTGSPFAAGSLPVSVAVDPTGKFAYVANRFDNTVSAYSIGANGALTPVTNSPFPTGTSPRSVAITPVPFTSSFAKLEIVESTFTLKESFTLGANSGGINPVKERVILQIGRFSVTFPAGSFAEIFGGTFAFVGVVDGVSFEVKIVPLGNKIFTFNAEAFVDLDHLPSPVTVVLTIGVNSGSTSVIPQFP